MVEVDRTQETLDQGHPVLDDAAQGRVDHRPARAEQGVWHKRCRHQGLAASGRQRVTGDGRVVGSQGRCQGEGVLHGSKGLGGRLAAGVEGAGARRVDQGQGGDPVSGRRGGPHARRGAQQGVHRLRDPSWIDQGHGAVPGRRQAQRDYEVTHGVDGLTAGDLVPVRVQVDVEVVGVRSDLRAGDHCVGVLLQHPCGVDRQVPVPQHVGSPAHQLRRVRHRPGLAARAAAQPGRGRLSLSALVLERLDGGLLKASQDLADRLVHARDPGYRHRAGDDAHLVGAVARVLGLPQ